MGAALDAVLNVWMLVDAGDFDRLAELVTPDVEFKSRGTLIGGLDQIRPFWEGTRRAFPDLRRDVVDYVETDDAIAVEVRAIGTNSGALTAAGGQQVPATGRQVTFESIDLIRLSGGKIRSWHDQHDQLGMLVQLGLAG